MWKFIVDVVHDFVSSLQPDVGRGFLHVSNVFLFFSVLQMDCGIHPGMSGLDALPYTDMVDPEEIDLLLVSQ